MGSITGEKRSYSTDDNKTNGTSQPEAKKVKFSPAPAITGRDIVLRYLKGEMTAAISYQKICTALQTISDWPSEVSRAQIIEQFLSMADLLDSRCDSLVHNLLKVRWDAIPARIMPDFKRFLADIGVRQIAYTELVYTTLISKLAPEMLVEEKEVDGKMKSTWKMKYTEEVQQEYYIMAHTIISHILKCFPMSSKLLLKVIQQGYPHYMQHPSKTEAFIRNIILLQQYAPMVRKEIWKTIFHRLINDDAHVSRGRTDTLFAIENEKAEEVTSSEATEATSHEDLLVRQLDASCVDVMTYISKCFDPEATLESAGWIVSEVISMEELFAILMDMMETAMLSASHVRSISCVFLHLCSLKEEFATKTLESLWKWMIRIPLAPSDTKKSHGASAYLASFLAKASYVDTNTTFMYLEKMMSWLTRYADQFGSGTKNVQSGTARHSVFYSLCQAFFTVFSYRYKEITKKSKFAEVRHWGIGKVVHSPLEPLKFVFRRVALCFSAITRSLQLVYCSHLIPLENECEMPFEHMFPFEGPYLPRSTPWLTPLIRTFTPLPEDVSQLTSVLRLKMEEPKKEKSDDTSFVDHGMDFLDVDDAFFHDTVRSRTNSFMITSLY